MFSMERILKNTYPLHYIRSKNFGDAINPYLYSRLTDRIAPVPLDSTDPKILACGSIAHEARPYDIVWGTGCNPDIELQTNETTRILSVRGPLTAELFYEHGHEDITEIYGDPVLLLRRTYRPRKINKSHEYSIGIIPHYADKSLMTRRISNAIYIDITPDDRLSFIDQVYSCDFIISSALHGIICAEAYGIPAVWVEFSDRVAGHGFKFRDYYLGTNRLPPEPLNWRNPHSINLSIAQNIAETWEPPNVDLDLLLSACPFNWQKTDYKRWMDNTRSWSIRNQLIADMCDEGAKVIEFGAGIQELRNMLPQSCTYTPSDIFKRTPDTIVCDINTHIFPDLSAYDTVIMSGVLEYLHDIPSFLEYLKSYPSIQTFICSYDDAPDLKTRQYNGWVNYYSYENLRIMLRECGGFMELKYMNYGNSIVMKLVKIRQDDEE